MGQFCLNSINTSFADLKGTKLRSVYTPPSTPTAAPSPSEVNVISSCSDRVLSKWRNVCILRQDSRFSPA